jgi:DNA-binding response OmpR family regulator
MVLIVEDERALRTALAMALSDEGFDVATAANGAAALDVLNEIEPDAIVLDLNMPILDGFQFADAYRRRAGKQAPVIVCTTRALDQRVRAICPAATVSKPIDIDRLVEMLKSYAS